MDGGIKVANYSTSNNQPTASAEDQQDRQRKILIGIAVAGLVLLVLLVLAIIYLLNPDTPTEKIRDIFIIFMALESLIVGISLIILIVQLAVLINLVQNEIKPILDSTNETLNTLRGTTTFLSDNLVEPVIKLNGYVAAIAEALRLVGIARGPKRRR